MTIKSSYLDFIIKCNDGLAQEMYENDKILYVYRLKNMQWICK